MISLRFPAMLSGFIVSLSVATASDWPQWMGPNRDGVWLETGTVDSFPKDGPQKLWSMPVKLGYGGPSVAAGKVYVHDYAVAGGKLKNDPSAKVKLNGSERVLCFDSTNGKSIWKREYPCAYEVSYPNGPRCTPTVDGDYLYTVGAMGDLHCLAASDGSVIWSKSFTKDYQAETPIWGFAGHPVVYQNSVICLVGGKNALLVAFDKKTGKELWKALSAKEPGYCSPRVIAAGGKSQLVLFHPTGLVSLDPATGKEYWSQEVKPMYGMSIMGPQIEGQTMYVGGIGGAGIAVTLATDKPTAHEAWKGTRTSGLYPVNMTPLIHDGVMYGCDQPGAFRAVDMKDGSRLWTSMLPVSGKDVAEFNVGSGTAFLVRNGEKYFLFSEQGDLIIAKLSPKEYIELGRAHILEPTGEAFGRKVVWSHPAFANGCVFARNDKELVCYSLKK